MLARTLAGCRESLTIKHGDLCAKQIVWHADSINRRRRTTDTQTPTNTNTHSHSTTPHIQTHPYHPEHELAQVSACKCAATTAKRRMSATTQTTLLCRGTCQRRRGVWQWCRGRFAWTQSMRATPLVLVLGSYVECLNVLRKYFRHGYINTTCT